MTEKLIMPLVHMNGSGKENLIQDYTNAGSAVSEAISVICNAYPHMRDYYPLDNFEEIFKQAREQHQARIDKLREVAVELHALALGVSTQ